MNRISTLSFLIIYTLFASSANSQTTYVNNGNSTSYNLGNNDSLYIHSGTYTGAINSFDQHAVIIVEEGASFQPSAFNNPKGTIYVYGNAKFSNINSNKNFDLENHGITEITGSTSMNGGEQNWNNYFGATLKFTGNVAMNSNAELMNNGVVIGGADFTMNNGSELTNNNMITITGSFSSNGGDLVNLGKLETGGITFNSGTSFTNTCRLVINGNITNNGTTLYNDGLIWIPAKYASAVFTNSGIIQNSANGKVKTRNFTNYGTINGSGYYYFIGTTYNTGTVGTNSATTDTIKIFDATRTNPSNIFDTQWGSVRANAIFVAFNAPDTTHPYVACAMEYKSMMTVLPVKWNFFYVNLSDNTPVLTWSSEQDPGTVFQVERSYDGTHFDAIGTRASVVGTTNYSFEDRSANTQNAIVYYRVRAIEPTGAQKLTETKAIRFSSRQGVSVQTAPNPFTSQFNINYQSASNGTITIKVYGMTGQLQASKTVTVSKGFNSIAVTEAALLARGIYVLQLSSDNQTIASQKIVKQ